MKQLTLKAYSKIMESKTLETLILDVADNGIATVTMNRPEKKNAANFTMWRELRETWNEISIAPDIRAVIMTGGRRCILQRS